MYSALIKDTTLPPAKRSDQHTERLGEKETKIGQNNYNCNRALGTERHLPAHLRLSSKRGEVQS
jgi:hypothetical protein